MSEKEIKSIIRRWIDAVNKGDTRTIRGLYVKGAKHGAVHRGLVTGAPEFFEKFGISKQPSTKSFKYFVKRIIVEGDSACIQFEDLATMKDGRKYYNYGVLIFVFQGKKIKSSVEYVDSLRYLLWGKRWDSDALMNTRIRLPQ